MSQETAIEIVKVGRKEYSLSKEDSEKLVEFASNAKELLEGMDNPKLPVIKIVHAAALYQMPKDLATGDEPTAKKFEGIIIHKHKANGYWEKSQEEAGNQPPDCSSPDGKTGTKFGDCKNCKLNQFSSEGGGKPCKNMMVLYVVLKDKLLPHVLVLPPTSIKSSDSMFSSLLSDGRGLSETIINFGLETAESQGKQKFARFVGGVAAEDGSFLAKAAKIKEAMLPFIKSQDIVSSISQEEFREPKPAPNANSNEY